jgi:hypothetical protein
VVKAKIGVESYNLTIVRLAGPVGCRIDRLTAVS